VHVLGARGRGLLPHGAPAGEPGEDRDPPRLHGYPQGPDGPLALLHRRDLLPRRARRHPVAQALVERLPLRGRRRAAGRRPAPGRRLLRGVQRAQPPVIHGPRGLERGLSHARDEPVADHRVVQPTAEVHLPRREIRPVLEDQGRQLHHPERLQQLLDRIAGKSKLDVWPQRRIAGQGMEARWYRFFLGEQDEFQRPKIVPQKIQDCLYRDFIGLVDANNEVRNLRADRPTLHAADVELWSLEVGRVQHYRGSPPYVVVDADVRPAPAVHETEADHLRGLPRRPGELREGIGLPPGRRRRAAPEEDGDQAGAPVLQQARQVVRGVRFHEVFLGIVTDGHARASGGEHEPQNGLSPWPAHCPWARRRA